MSVAIISPSRLSKPSAVIASSMTDKERLAFGTRDIDFCLDAAERASEYGGMVLRDRARNIAVPVTAGTESTLNGYPAIDFQVSNEGRMLAGYQVPASYFLAVACSIDAITDTNSFVASTDQTGDRLFFGLLGTSGNLRLDHGTDSGKNLAWDPAPASTGSHLFWASFDAATGQAAVGMDAVTAGATGTISVPHKGQATTDFFGGATGPAPIDGKAVLAVVVPRYLGGAAQAASRAAILGWMAETIGVSLGV